MHFSLTLILIMKIVMALILFFTFLRRMQVEVSKYTEGVVDKALRPNGLPKSLIRYDGK